MSKSKHYFLQKSINMLMKGIKILLKKKKPESENMATNDTKISHSLKNKGDMSIGKDIMKCERIKICFKHLTFSLNMRNTFSSSKLSYPFIQTNTKISFLAWEIGYRLSVLSKELERVAFLGKYKRFPHGCAMVGYDII